MNLEITGLDALTRLSTRYRLAARALPVIVRGAQKHCGERIVTMMKAATPVNKANTPAARAHRGTTRAAWHTEVRGEDVAVCNDEIAAAVLITGATYRTRAYHRDPNAETKAAWERAQGEASATASDVAAALVARL